MFSLTGYQNMQSIFICYDKVFLFGIMDHAFCNFILANIKVADNAAKLFTGGGGGGESAPK